MAALKRGTRVRKRKTSADVPVWPSPREVAVRPGQLRLVKPLQLTVSGNSGWLDVEADRAVATLNAAVEGVVEQGHAADGGVPLIVGGLELLLRQLGLDAPPSDEGYVLSITPDRIWLAGVAAAGAYYGVQTLAQLLSASNGESLPLVTIRDWPACPIRAAHVYMPPREHLDFFIGFLDVLARYRYNALMLEVGGGMEYERHPEINEGWRRFCREAQAYDPQKCTHRKSMGSDYTKADISFESKYSRHPTGPCALQGSRYFYKDSTHTELGGGDCLTKDEVRRIVEECAKRHIEVIPEVQALSHSYYLCVAHPEIAERQDDPWPDTYCPSNPKSYELLFDVMDEVIEVVRPRMMHIGHDEVYTLRVCPKCRKRSGHDLFADDVIKIRDFLASRGVRTAMWGDRLMQVPLKKGEKPGAIGGYAAKRVCPDTGRVWEMPATYNAAKRIPKDVLMLDWQWGNWQWSGKETSERSFTKHGFEVLFGNFEPLKFPDWERRSKQKEVLGAELSTWNGVTPEAFGHDCIFYQFFPGSTVLWSGRSVSRREVAERMARDLVPTVDLLTDQRRWLVQGGAGRARPLSIAGASRELDDHMLGQDAKVTTALGTGAFQLQVRNGRPARAIVLEKTSSSSATVKLGRRLERLLVLHGTSMKGLYWRPTYYSYHRGPAVLLQYQVRYADGQSRSFEARYGEEIGPIEGGWGSAKATYCYRAVPVIVGPERALYAQEWVNPRPDVAVESVAVSLGTDAVDEGAVIVAAMSAVD